jgi:rubrerythrin
MADSSIDRPELQPQVPPAVFPSAASQRRPRETRAEVIKLAIQKERHSIGYYTALTEFALGQDNTQAIQAILEEERRHLRILKQSLQQASG